MAISASYYKEMSIALPGQISDTSRYNVDGACVLSGEDTILAGLVVAVDTTEKVAGHKLIKKLSTANDKPVGVAIRSHFATTDIMGEMVYRPGDGINVMTSGRVWVIAKTDFTPQFGTAVKVDHATGKVAVDGDITTTWSYAGGITKWGDMTLIEVQLHQI